MLIELVKEELSLLNNMSPVSYSGNRSLKDIEMLFALNVDERFRIRNCFVLLVPWATSPKSNAAASIA